MFEERCWAELDDLSGEPLPPYDEPELSEEDYLAEVERMIAADPLNRPEPCAAEVIARGETEAMSPGLIAQLEAIDPSTVDEDLRVGLSKAWDRAANYCHAHRGLAVAGVVAASPDSEEVPRELHAAGQLGAALGVGRNHADELVAACSEFASRLPATRELALAGGLTWRKTSSLATSTVALTDEQALHVETRVLANAWGQPVGKFDADVRKAVDLVDPDGIADRRREQRRDIRLVRHHYGTGMGQLFADLPSEKLDVVWLAADRWARRRKGFGDPRTLRELRVEALFVWASSFLSHGDETHCDRAGHTIPAPTELNATDTSDIVDGGDDIDHGPFVPDVPVESDWSLPTGHGRTVNLTVVWDLTSLLGLTRHCGRLLDSDTVIDPDTIRRLIAGGVRLRRGVIDGNGHLTDLTPKAWLLPPTDSSTHRAPVELLLTTTARLPDLGLAVQWSLEDLDSTDPHLATVLRELLDYPLSADELDAHPDDEKPSARLAAFVSLRAGHPINPTAGPSNATAADLEHHTARSVGGKTERNNLGPVVRRWHRLKTFDDWTVKQTPDGWQWTSPTGRKYVIEPFDYRLGP